MIDQSHKGQQLQIRQGVENMLQVAKQAGFPAEHWSELHNVLYRILKQFRVTFSPAAPNLQSLEIKLY